MTIINYDHESRPLIVMSIPNYTYRNILKQSAEKPFLKWPGAKLEKSPPSGNISHQKYIIFMSPLLEELYVGSCQIISQKTTSVSAQKIG